MCGRYIVKITAGIEQYFRLKDAPKPPWQESFNFAPTAQVPVVLEREGDRVGTTMRWGLVPFFARGVPGKYSTHNARIETFQTNASYREPWKSGRRCLQVTSGFYEWQLGEDGRKQPYFIRTADREAFAFAALWDRSSTEDRQTVIESVTHITMPAPAGGQVYRIHNQGSHPHRMPAILRHEDEDVWLHGTTEEALAVLQPYPDDLIVSWPVAPRVNSSRSAGAELIDPIDPGANWLADLLTGR
jgi:putative SOS response-associated peptidase YedK